MWAKLISSLLFVSLAACQTIGNQVVRTDHHGRYVEVHSNGDDRTAMPPAGENKDFRIAATKLKRELKRRPHHDGFVNLAQLNLVMGKLPEAEKAAQKAVRLNVKSKSARLVLAQVALRKGNVDLALILMNAIGGDRSRDSQVQNMLGMIALKQKDSGLAMGYFNKALELNPSDVSVRMNLGVTYLRYRQLPEASAQFERVLVIMPDHADAKLHLAILQSARQEYGLAEETFEGILKAREGNPLALYNLAILEEKRKNYDEALAHLKLYLRTGTAKKQDVDGIFALIGKIQKKQGASEQELMSDRDIQTLAAQGERSRSQRQAKQSVVEEPIEDFTSDPGAQEIDELETELLSE